MKEILDPEEPTDEEIAENDMDWTRVTLKYLINCLQFTFIFKNQNLKNRILQ